ncbi:MAG: hypothetical protein CM1200mP20_11440 [Pseudomonadota bacterium]|nr:MAG: hypothetical protein CM1200mP20_11440 [Pseudomonadota bacterium]
MVRPERCSHGAQSLQSAAKDFTRDSSGVGTDTAGGFAKSGRFDLRLHGHIVAKHLQHLPSRSALTHGSSPRG